MERKYEILTGRNGEFGKRVLATRRIEGEEKRGREREEGKDGRSLLQGGCLRIQPLTAGLRRANANTTLGR